MFWLRLYELEEIRGYTRNVWFGWVFTYENWYSYNNSGEEFKEVT